SAAWDAVSKEMDVQEDSTRDRAVFFRSVAQSVLPYVRTFRLCGLSNICLDEVYSAPLSAQPEKVDANPWDLVYHIFYRGDAEEFVDGIAFEAIESIKGLLKTGRSRAVFAAVESALRNVLGKYLYYSPICGRTELCVFSGSAPISALGRH
ncbi:MAG TPA: hypothetical protein VLR94_08030, partial [Acidobacteriota bacterium]|nr:hypothetical protein [Acidobacteriota bacterium]